MLSLLLAVALAMSASVQDAPTAVYQKYERAYLRNNYTEMAKWLLVDAELSQTLHVGEKAETRRMSSEQMLKMMHDVGRQSQFKGSDPDKIQISEQSESGFCASAETLDVTRVAGQKYQEREARRACFVRDGDAYRVRLHSIDIYYTPAK